MKQAPTLPTHPVRRSHAPRLCKTRASGFSLIEVLVAIVVLSFGMLGMVGMQAFALQSNRDARLQSQAASLARELAEMMRGNKVTAVLTGTANPYLGNFTTLAMASPSYCMASSNAGTGCTSPADVATAEMTDWLSRVSAELPGARVTVCFDSAPYDTNGLPQWNCTPTGAGEIVVIKLGWTRTTTDGSQTGSGALERVADSGSRPYLVIPVTSGSAT